MVTAAAFFLWYDALRRLGADRAGLFAGLVPVGALLATVALGLGQAGPADVTGALLVAAGVVLGLRRPGRDGRGAHRPQQTVGEPTAGGGHGRHRRMPDGRFGYALKGPPVHPHTSAGTANARTPGIPGRTSVTHVGYGSPPAPHARLRPTASGAEAVLGATRGWRVRECRTGAGGRWWRPR
ncbi:DMT family transporter [Actinocorallia aurantiaca]|uniref:DMT family transporter n=1 Tax=Actinocorallia aurantiaca TaxID=46204 RepID=UPI0031D07AF8